MRLTAKFSLVIVSVSALALLFHFIVANKDLASVQNTPDKETAAYTTIIDLALKQDDIQAWPGLYQNAAEVKKQIFDYQMKLADDHSFVFTVTSYVNKDALLKAKPDVMKKLTGTYRIKGHVIYFENLQGHTGLMSEQARSAINEWTQDVIEFKNEDSVMRLRRRIDNTGQGATKGK